ncbi:LamG-like jellyroll fold domain-containing protein [Actinokineospora sp. UTMC 2448]|uniref:LamG-like jellyroll fold domain-containing protein n=1 Tax=Actinokineospora sp. UTMC 2448 TaxID=2268449 RepID=UPI002200587F|nr:LamG-like jellyroll fold domain-containing protein [Actinokineospora sp. UTMC 2448]UVS81642.1 Exoglucanase B precursor [Actinokineospora sp. UTMC 2448]
MRRSLAALAVQLTVAGLLPVAAVTFAATPAAALPAGFTQQTVLSGLTQPMAVEFGADGRVFVAEKSGLVKVFDGLSDPTPSVFADLRTNVYNQHDRGLMGLALAPDFPADPSVYVLYSHDAAIGGTAPRWGAPGASNDSCPNPPGETGDGCVISGRLSVLDAAGAERVLVEDWCQQYPSHSVGELAFGPDGYLYASAGDGASYVFADYGQDGSPRNPCGDPPTGVGGTQTVPSAEGGALRAQDVQTMGDPMGLDGTIIRIDPATGAGAPGNPMAGSADANARRVVAAGLRNPFRFDFRPGTGELWLGDVGWSTWEEVNRLANPADGTVDNFGWPCKEGTAAQSGYNIGLTMCQRISTGTVPTVNPHYAYRHGQSVVTGDGCSTGSGSSISAAAFYRGGAYPDTYDGAFFFGDYSRRCIWTMRAGAGGVPDPATRQVFQQEVFPVDLTAGPNGDLYYVDIAFGEVRRFRYGTGNQAPIAAVTATPAQGAVPLTVSFSAAGSSDPNGDPLTYAWDLDGDGAFDDATGVTASRTYTATGTYDVSVQARDPGGLTDEAGTRVLAGSHAPTPVISTPDTGFTWAVGDTIAFAGSATDAEDGPLPASALSWRAVLHHCDSGGGCHEHDLVGFDGVASGAFDGPDHDYPSYVELRLTARDSSGATATVSRRLDPKVGTVVIRSDPPGLTATLSDTSGPTPLTVPAIVGSRMSLSVPQDQTLAGGSYAFRSWSDGGARAHDIIVGAGTTTLTAVFERTGSGDDSLVAAYAFDEGAGGSLTDRSGHGHTGTLSGPAWAAGRHGGGLSFDGVDDWVTVADTAALDLTDRMTLSAWLRPASASGWRTAVMKERQGGLAYALYGAGLDRPSGYLSIGNDVTATGPSALPVGSWSHVAFTYDGAAMRLYVNGNLVATVAQTGSAAVSAAALRLGGNSVWGEYFAGVMDDVRVYNRALSAAEIAADRDTPVSSDTTAPSAPGAPSATGGLGTVALSWTEATDDVGVTGYDVHRGAPGFTVSPSTRIATVTGLTHTDTGLAAGTYAYRVVARDGGGNASAPSAEATAVVSADTTAPSVAVTGPSGTISGLVSVTATASDSGSGVAGVQFLLNGQPLGGEDTSAPYTVSWDTRTVANGAYTLTARARDNAGNSAVSAAVSVTVSNTGPAPGAPVASYNFDEGAGSVLGDRSGNANHGAVAGAAWVAGRTGGALSFDGVDDMVTVADTPALRATTALTVSAWVRPTGGADWRTVVMKERAGGLSYALYSDNAAGRPAGYGRVGAVDVAVTGPSALPTATWTHLAMTYDGSALRLYVDGVLVSTEIIGGSLATSTGALRLGGNAVWGEYFVGAMDDVRVYNRTLTAAEIAADRSTAVA